MSLSSEVLHASGLKVDECYTVTWRESKYTLLHLPGKHKIRKTAMNKIVAALEKKHGLILGEIMGYDSIASTANPSADDSIISHPGFKILIEVLNTRQTDLEWWMESGDLISNKNGLLWNYIETIPADKMTRTQMIKRIHDWTPIVQDHKKLKLENASLQQALLSETSSANEMMQEVMRLREEIRKIRNTR